MRGGKFGFINTEGNRITKFEFDRAYDFSEGLAAVKIGDKWGYINNQGQLSIDAHYDYADSFQDGLAVVNIGGKIDAYRKVVTGGRWGIH